MPTIADLVGAIIVTGLAAIAGVVVACMPRLLPATARGVLFFAGFFGGMAVGVWVSPTGLTLQAGSALEAVLGGWILGLFALIGFGLVPYAIAPKPVLARSDYQERIDLEPTEMGAWSRTITGTLFVWGGQKKMPAPEPRAANPCSMEDRVAVARSREVRLAGRQSDLRQVRCAAACPPQ